MNEQRNKRTRVRMEEWKNEKQFKEMYRQRNFQEVKRLRRLGIQYCVDLCENVRTVSGYGTELAPVLSQDLCSALPCPAMRCDALLSSLPLD